MEGYLFFILQESIEEVLLNESCFLEKLEVEVVYFESESHIELSSFLSRALEAFPLFICYDFEKFDLLVDFWVSEWIIFKNGMTSKLVQISISLFKNVKLEETRCNHLTLSQQSSLFFCTLAIFLPDIGFLYDT